MNRFYFSHLRSAGKNRTGSFLWRKLNQRGFIFAFGVLLLGIAALLWVGLQWYRALQPRPAAASRNTTAAATDTPVVRHTSRGDVWTLRPKPAARQDEPSLFALVKARWPRVMQMLHGDEPPASLHEAEQHIRSSQP